MLKIYYSKFWRTDFSPRKRKQPQNNCLLHCVAQNAAVILIDLIDLIGNSESRAKYMYIVDKKNNEIISSHLFQTL